LRSGSLRLLPKILQLPQPLLLGWSYDVPSWLPGC